MINQSISWEITTVWTLLILVSSSNWLPFLFPRTAVCSLLAGESTRVAGDREWWVSPWPEIKGWDVGDVGDLQLTLMVWSRLASPADWWKLKGHWRRRYLWQFGHSRIFQDIQRDPTWSPDVWGRLPFERVTKPYRYIYCSYVCTYNSLNIHIYMCIYIHIFLVKLEWCQVRNCIGFISVYLLWHLWFSKKRRQVESQGPQGPKVACCNNSPCLGSTVICIGSFAYFRTYP